MIADYYAKQGDTGSTIGGVLTDDNGAVGINGATLRFIMTPVTGGEAKVAANATNAQMAGGANGAWTYTFDADDLDEPGWYRAEVEVTFSGGAKRTFPNDGYEWVLVTPELG